VVKHINVKSKVKTSEKIEDLGEWRRTHYSVEINQNLEGKEVTVFGWVSSIREQGGIIFLIIQDKDGIVQVAAHKDITNDEVFKKLKGIRKHSAVGVKGIVRRIEKAPHGAEIIPKEIRILGVARYHPPFSLFGGKIPSIDKRLEIRALDLRRAQNIAIFRIRHTVLSAVREFLIKNGYLETNTPKIISTATEGGAALFPVLYYDKEAFLAQSPQLYKEQLILTFEKVFEIGPVFRAEQSRTLKHVSEFTSDRKSVV